MIDEFATLVAEQPAFLHALVGVAQRGRSLGVHLLLATQRPAGVISDDIRANTNIRLALRLHDTADAIDVVGDPSPTTIPRRPAGRAVLRLGPDEHVTFQAAGCTASDGPGGANDLTTIVRRRARRPPPGGRRTADRAVAPAAAQRADRGRRGRPNRRPRHSRRARPARRSGPAGPTRPALDDRRARPRRRWPRQRRDVGARRRRLGLRSMPTRPPTCTSSTAVGDAALRRSVGHPRCAAVVLGHEGERLRRLLLRLSGEIDRRCGRGPGRTADRAARRRLHPPARGSRRARHPGRAGRARPHRGQRGRLRGHGGARRRATQRRPTVGAGPLSVPVARPRRRPPRGARLGLHRP